MISSQIANNFLVLASKAGRIEEVEALLEVSGIDVNWKSAQDETALVAACRAGHREVVSRLLMEDVELNVACGNETALHVACSRGDESLCAMLMDAGADGEKRLGGEHCTPFAVGVKAGHIEMVSRLRRLAKHHTAADQSKRLVTEKVPRKFNEDSFQLPMLQKHQSTNSNSRGITPRKPESVDLESGLLMQLDLTRRQLLEEQSRADAAERRLIETEARTEGLLEQLDAVAQAAKINESEHLRLQLQVENLRGHQLNGKTNHELVALEKELAAAAQRIRAFRLQAQRRLPDAYICPITRDLMKDPVVCADGHTYERSAIEHWLLTHETSPKTGLVLSSKHLVTNFAIKSAIDEELRAITAEAETCIAPDGSSTIESEAEIDENATFGHQR